jgi:uncharacterized membrane protein YdjX (TVP38/TMEM64 family)
MLPGKPADRKKLLIRIVAVAVVLLAGAAFLLRGTDYHRLIDHFMADVRGAGPWVFFGAMALLPAVGMPMMAFTIPAGPAFSGVMGVGGVIAAALAALTFNLILGYSLARWALRPWVTRLLVRLGYRVPTLDSGDITDLIVLLRVTPGIPFFVQNYLLGLAEAPLLRVLLISCPFQWAFAIGVIVFGDALTHGKGAVAIGTFCALAAVMVILHMVRRRYSRRQKPA